MAEMYEDEEYTDDIVVSNYDPFKYHFWLPETEMEAIKAINSDIKPNFNEFLGYMKTNSHSKKSALDQFTMNHFKSFLRQETLSNFEKEMLKLAANYEDIFYCRRNFETGETLRKLYSLHALNHAYRTRDQILMNNAKEKKTGKVDDSMRDQSFHRAKVLILLPTRNAALNVINCMASLMPKKSSIGAKKRFESEFGVEEDELITNEEKAKAGRKPLEYFNYFTGNTDDHFRLGLSVSKKTLKLYTSFEESDIILASTLGLKTILDGNDKEETDLYFLSSIEVLIIDQLEMLLMQNWTNLITVLSQLNCRPSRIDAKCHLLRCRHWCLTGQGACYRQNWVCSSLHSTQMAGLFAFFTNFEAINFFPPCLPVTTSLGGHLPAKLRCPLPSSDPLKIDLIEFQVPRGSAAVSEARFKAFERRILPRLRRGVDRRGILLYIPDYYDLVELRTCLRKDNLDICCIDEYTSDKKVNRFRTLFAQGRIRILLYSERYHFYRRRRLPGIRSVIFYGPPTFPQFLAEICDQIQIKANDESKAEATDKTNSNNGELNVSLFSQMLYHKETDAWQMGQIFGHMAMNKMIS